MCCGFKALLAVPGGPEILGRMPAAGGTIGPRGCGEISLATLARGRAIAHFTCKRGISIARWLFRALAR